MNEICWNLLVGVMTPPWEQILFNRISCNWLVVHLALIWLKLISLIKRVAWNSLHLSWRLTGRASIIMLLLLLEEKQILLFNLWLLHLAAKNPRIVSHWVRLNSINISCWLRTLILTFSRLLILFYVLILNLWIILHNWVHLRIWSFMIAIFLPLKLILRLI